MKQVFHHFSLWEEVPAGMWRHVPKAEFDAHAKQAADLMRDPPAFKAAMMRAVTEWKYSVEHNLSDMGQNRKAWLGHAGSVLAIGSPEDATRAGWCTLNRHEQDEANRVAQEVIDFWEQNQGAPQCQNVFSDSLF